MKVGKINTNKMSKGLTRVMSFTSGKGGVGKTSLVVNVGCALSDLGKRVLILDADLGLANVDVLLGVSPKSTLRDVISGRKHMREITVAGPSGLTIIPAASGVEGICRLDAGAREIILSQVEEIAADYDYLLIDTSAGISSEVMYFNSASSEVVCVLNPEPTSLTDAYALIKVLNQQYGEKEIRVIANNVANEAEGQKIFNRLEKAVARFLHIDLVYMGAVPSDPSVRESIQEQRPLVKIFPTSQAGLALSRIAREIDAEFPNFRVKGGMQFFFKQILEVSGSGIC